MVRASWTDPKRWRERAEEIRSVAQRMQDELARGVMLQLAHDYERLADEAERRSHSAGRS
jgi:hypothetical protein